MYVVPASKIVGRTDKSLVLSCKHHKPLSKESPHRNQACIMCMTKIGRDGDTAKVEGRNVFKWKGKWRWDGK